jgi:hypothetical protein
MAAFIYKTPELTKSILEACGVDASKAVAIRYEDDVRSTPRLTVTYYHVVDGTVVHIAKTYDLKETGRIVITPEAQ